MRRLVVINGTSPHDEAQLPEDAAFARPVTRGDCARGVRPCPWVSCRHHNLGIEEDDHGTLRVSRRVLPARAKPDRVERFTDEISDHVVAMTETCSLDIAERPRVPTPRSTRGARHTSEGSTLDGVGQALNVTRERVRQIEEKAIRRLPRIARARGLR